MSSTEEEIKKGEEDYWAMMHEYQFLGESIATKEVELQARQHALDKEKDQLIQSKVERAHGSDRMGILGDRIARMKAIVAKTTPEEYKCEHCGLDTRIRNPALVAKTGDCDHIYYPNNACKECEKLRKNGGKP